MEYILNAGQMKQCDSDTIHKLGVPSLVLMERAALCTVEEMERFGCDMTSVLVVCGSGNNGGDGFAVARLLWEKQVSVTLAFVGKETSLTEETALQKKICENCGIKISSNAMDYEYTTIVDAIFGIGLSRKVEGSYAEVIHWMNRQSACRVAVDMPSGVETDHGYILGAAVKADLTVTFAYRKIGQILYPGTEYCGQVVCRNIGIPRLHTVCDVHSGEPEGGRGCFSAKPSLMFTYDKEDLCRAPRRPAYSNKGTFGRVLLIAGSTGMSGAACLAARGAYRAGSGLVEVFTPACNRQVIQMYLPEAIVTPWDEESDLAEMLGAALKRADAAGIGPGLGKSAGAGKLLEYIMKNYSGPLVVDADGLNLLAEQTGLMKNTKAQVILTPHVGEMLRLVNGQAPDDCKITKENITRDIPGIAAGFASKNKVVCVLKDARTVVSDGERSYLNTSGNSGMATGGSGDVLAGVICGLLAQGMQTFDAAALGVYIHGLAGDAAGEELGAYGMLAGDIAERVGQVLK